MSRRRKVLLAFLCLLLMAGAGAYWFLNSGWLDRYIVERAKAEVEKALGAKLEIQSLRIDLWRGRAVAAGVTLHGMEKPGDPPMFHADEADIEIGLATFSRTKVDLRGLVLKQPTFRLITYPDGTTNWPKIQARTGAQQNGLESILNLRLGHLDVENGEFSWDEQRTKFDINAKNFAATMDYLPASRIYRGKVLAANVLYQQSGFGKLEGDSNVEFSMDNSRITIDKASFQSPMGTNLNAHGEIHNIDGTDSPLKLLLDIDGVVALKQVHPFLRAPIDPSGLVNYTGKFLYEARRGVELHGDLRARDVFYRDATSRIGPMGAKSKIDLLPGRLTLTGLHADGFGGTLDGRFRWDQQEGWNFDGDLTNLDLETGLQQLNVRNTPWSGKIGGPITASGGKAPIRLEADLEIASTRGPSPMSGLLAFTYHENGNQLLARSSFLALPHSRLVFSGELSKGIAVEFRTTDLTELTPVAQLAGWQEEQLPVELRSGEASIQGTLRGTLKAPRFQGSIAADAFTARGLDFSAFKSRVDYGQDLVALDDLQLTHAATRIKGNFRAVLDEGKLGQDSLLSGNADAQIGDLQTQLNELGLKESLSGTAQLAVALHGTLSQPSADGNIKSPSLRFRDFQFDQISAAFSASRRELRVPEWEARLGRQPARGLLNLKAGGDDWKIGTGNATVKLDSLILNAIPQYRDKNLDLNAQVTADTQLDFAWSPEGISASKIDGRLLLANITRFGRPVGQLEFTSRTAAGKASLTATGNIRKQTVKGDATIQLGTKLDTELRLQLPKLDFPTIAQLLSKEQLPSPLPYEGGAEASFYFKGPLLDPAGWDGRLTIPQLQLAPNKDYVKETLPQVADVVLKNDGPIVVEFRRGFIGARDVKLVAKDTNFTTSILYRANSGGLSGQAKGNINLAILSTLQPDLIATGVAALDTSIQGTSADPQINGKLDFKNASFYLRDVITGLDKVNGTILFDKNRATIDNLKAQTGGGELQLTGFIGFGRTLSYRMQAQATQVRLRYPEGVSTSANGTLALSGTTAQSILTGNITILRSNIGQIDTAQLIAGNSVISDVSEPIRNEFLKNLQFDVKIDAAQNAEFSTSLTRDIKGEVALRLRGTPGRPILLGQFTVTQGEIDFFGSRYDISRGEVQFNNPLRIEPVISLDLETRVRGVTISMNFSGPANKLNMSYRSDPPLQSSEILALLTVGRNPGTSGSLTQTPVGQSPGGVFGNDSSVILGAAVTAGINGRLQRFFGISRVRIDPQLTGIDNVPQARLTLEQQVSRDVTLTYITNLNRTQQQIVRIDWDISKAWSVVAVRDENGIFGVDLFFRKRLK
ncbi:translocation/assembly module TamB domain-containing protein [Bryobacter aggregatus]|uniref:translocation/assembly module TamB domain-containing protein n=1 Tax=Bryobacter aggregatus TaxID=360054 RepID=UPI0004E19407|nr:translocation/assembly module TamB domain-containing protein [Bryobacter aggregatus]